MPNHLAHFAIAADDVERARRFYERAFGWRIEAWGPPDFYAVFTDADKPQRLYRQALRPPRGPSQTTGQRQQRRRMGMHHCGR